jgi:hypothetical protein
MTDIAGGKRALLAFEQWPRRHASMLVAITSLALIACYLSAWMNMPIYPDEIAIRLMGFRAIADHGLRYPAFPYRTGSYSTPLAMLPAAYILSAVDWLAGWSFVRVIPLISLLALGAAAILAMRRRTLALLLPLGFVGVAGSGLILMRPEFLLALQGATLFIGYWLIRTERNSTLDASWIVGSTIVGLLSIQVHPEGFVLFPITLIITGWLIVKSASKTVQALGCFAAVWIVAASFAQWSMLASSMGCPKYPELEGSVKDLLIFGPNRWPEISSSLSRWISKFRNYADSFTFKEATSSTTCPDLVTKTFCPWVG